MRIRIVTRPASESIDDIRLDYFEPGHVYDVGASLACLLLAEGWAEFYQNTEILETEVRLGGVDSYTLELLKRPLLPLDTLFTVDQHSPYYHEEDKGSMFYAESWALTHFLKLKDVRENTHRLSDYLDLVHEDLVHEKVDSVSAASQAFGDL